MVNCELTSVSSSMRVASSSRGVAIAEFPSVVSGDWDIGTSGGEFPESPDFGEEGDVFGGGVAGGEKN